MQVHQRLQLLVKCRQNVSVVFPAFVWLCIQWSIRCNSANFLALVSDLLQCPGTIKPTIVALKVVLLETTRSMVVAIILADTTAWAVLEAACFDNLPQ